MKRPFHSILIRTATALLTCLLAPLTALADDPVCFYLSDGRVEIYPAEYVQSCQPTATGYTLTLFDGEKIDYTASDIDSVSHVLPEKPYLETFKFNDKYNDQLATDYEADTVEELLEFTIGAIGKSLTPSFSTYEDDAIVTVDGVEQTSKVSRHRFDRDIVYTASFPGQTMLKMTKLTDEVWSEPAASRWEPVALKTEDLSTNQPSNYEDKEGLHALLDDNFSTFFQSTWGSGAYTQKAENVYLDIALPVSLSQFKLYYRTRELSNYSPLAITIYASHDGVRWTEIDDLTAADDDLPSGSGVEYTSDPIDLGGTWEHLRLEITEAEHAKDLKDADGNEFRLYYLAMSELRILRFIPGEGEPQLLQPATYECAMMPYGRDYTVRVHWLTDDATAVPRIDIWTDNGRLPADKVTYLHSYIRIDGNGVFDNFEDSVLIRGRGNSSWAGENGKSPYNLKFSTKVKPFGLTKGKRWCLIANAQSGSMMANAIGMKIARMVEADYANHVIPVDLYINDQYRGSYTFTEKIGLSNNSVDLNEETSVLLELDSYYDEQYRFRSDVYALPVNIKDPDLTDEEFAWKADDTFSIYKKEFNSFVNALDQNTGFEKKMDVPSFCRYFLVNDLIKNQELCHPKSTFMFKEGLEALNSKYHFGPVWDLDWAFGYEQNRNYYQTTAATDFFSFNASSAGNRFFKALRYSSDIIKKEYYRTWVDFMENHYEELFEYARDYYDYAHPSFEKNATKWGDGRSYEQSLNNLRTWFDDRTEYLATQIDKYDLSIPDDVNYGDVNGDGDLTAADVVCLVSYLLGETPKEFVTYNADIDHNGIITVTDLVWTISFVTAAEAPQRRLPSAEVALSINDFDAAVGESATTLVSLRAVEEADDEPYTAARFTVLVPDGLTLEDAALAPAYAMSHRLSAEQDADGYTHLLVWSDDNAPLLPGTPLLTLTVRPDGVVAEQQRSLTLADGSIATTDGDEHRLFTANARFNLSTGLGTLTADVCRLTGGEALTVDALQPVTLHVRTLDGILVRTLDVQPGTHSYPLPQGVYLVETEKIVIN